MKQNLKIIVGLVICQLIVLNGISQISYNIENKRYYCLDSNHTRILAERLVQAEIDSIKAKCLQDYIDYIDTNKWTSCDSLLSTSNSIISEQEHIIAQNNVTIINCKNNIKKLNDTNYRLSKLNTILGGVSVISVLITLMIVL